LWPQGDPAQTTARAVESIAPSPGVGRRASTLVHRAILLAQRQRRTAPQPTSLNFAEAAPLPLTAITAWERPFDRIFLKRGEDRRSGADVQGALIATADTTARHRLLKRRGGGHGRARGVAD
jgi:hypothetical protein